MFAQRNRSETEECLDLLRSLGFSHARKETEAAFEQHLLELNKFLVVSGSIVAEIAGLHFYDNPIPEERVGELIVNGGRVFDWQHRFWTLPSSRPITAEVVQAFAKNDLSPGFPIGIVTNDASRKREILALGGVTESEFCTTVHLLSGGEIRLYTGLRKLLSFGPQDMN